MGSENSKIRESIVGIINQTNKENLQIFSIQVTEIDSEANTFSGRNIKGDGNELISGIRSGMGGNSGITVNPAVGSNVLVAKNLHDNTYYLLKNDEIGNVTVKANEYIYAEGEDIYLFDTTRRAFIIVSEDKISITNDKSISIGLGGCESTSINGETIFLGDKFSESFGGLTKTNKLTEQLNKIENKVNEIITALGTLGVTLTPLVPTDQSQIGNLKILHFD